jgi:hypothetical protein
LFDFTDPEVVSKWMTGRSSVGGQIGGALGGTIGYMMGSPWAGFFMGELAGTTALAPVTTKPILKAAGGIDKILSPALKLFSKPGEMAVKGVNALSTAKGGLIPEAKKFENQLRERKLY